MVDIHSHILPFVDDGATGFEDFLSLAEISARSGVDVLVATPHSNQIGRYENYESDALKDLFREMENILKRYRIPLQILRGAEIFLRDDEWMEKILDGRLMPLNGTNNYLVEFAFDEFPERMTEQLERMLDLKKTPVIAHPERYYCIQDRPEIVREWVKMGCFVQVNRGSVMGQLGRNCLRAVHYLLDRNLVTCIASDAHSPRKRSTQMSDVQDYIVRRYSFDKMVQLLEENPRKLLNIVDNRPQPGQRRKVNAKHF